MGILENTMKVKAAGCKGNSSKFRKIIIESSVILMAISIMRYLVYSCFSMLGGILVTLSLEIAPLSYNKD